jgi:hypothetical protein
VKVKELLTLEVVGYKKSECSPFPCDENRTCGLISCAPSGELIVAYNALKMKIEEEYSGKIEMKLTLLDEEVPQYIKEIYENEHPAIPMILLNGEVLPVGRVSWTHIQDAISKKI